MSKLNKSKLIAQWWQYFINDIEPPADVYFVKSRMIRPNQSQVNKTWDRIEQDKTVVLPVNNWISLAKSKDIITKAKMIKTARTRMDSLAQLKIKINDKEIKPERVMSCFFNLKITQKNILYDFPQRLQLGEVEVGDYVALSDGYWCFLKLKNGEYKIETISSCATGIYSLAMEHELLIMSAASGCHAGERYPAYNTDRTGQSGYE